MEHSDGFFTRVRAAADSIADSGTVRITADVPQMPCASSTAMKSEVSTASVWTPYEYRTMSVESAEPKNARMSVFDIVPIMSLHTIIPEANSSRLLRDGFLSCISNKAATSDKATSMTAPSDEIIAAAKSRCDRSMPVACVTRSRPSMFSSTNPLMCRTS